MLGLGLGLTRVSGRGTSAPAAITLSSTTVEENDAGAVIGTLSLVAEGSGTVQSWSVDDARFEVVAGELKLVDGTSLDYEVEPFVVIVVTATDDSATDYDQSFTIVVQDVDDVISLIQATTTISATTEIQAN